MATMYPLFFGLLLTAVCGIVGASDCFLVLRNAYCDMRGEGGRFWNKEQGLRNKDGFGFLVLRNAYCDMGGEGGRVGNKEQGLRNKDGVDVSVHVRTRIIQIASAEIGVQEATGRNDGARVEEYLRYTGLGSGHEWCAAFVSWCYGQAGLPQPRNPWSPALFPKARTYCSRGSSSSSSSSKGNPCGSPGSPAYPDTTPINKADLFAIYGATAKRINHVGIVQRHEASYIHTIEGNSNNRVESRRRHLSTIYALSDWIML